MADLFRSILADSVKTIVRMEPAPAMHARIDAAKAAADAVETEVGKAAELKDAELKDVR